MIDPEKIYHVLPNNDLKEHCEACIFPPTSEPYCDCQCKPEHKVEGEVMLIIHNSFDGRENFEFPNKVRIN